MPDRFDDKKLRTVAEPSDAFSGDADSFPSGSQNTGEMSVPRKKEAAPDRCNDIADELLESPYWIVDILPEQVPEDSAGQFFAVEKYYLQPERLRAVRARFADVLLRLNCYYDMRVSFDPFESWDPNPDPESLAEKLEALPGNAFFRAFFPEPEAMIDLDPSDTYMTVYNPDPVLLSRIRALAAAAGLFVWRPPETE